MELRTTSCKGHGVLAGFNRKRQLFDVTATYLLKLIGINLKGISMVPRDKYINLVSFGAGFSVVSLSKLSSLLLFVIFLYHS